MLNLVGTQIYLRALEPGDLEFLYKVENNPLVWEVSGTVTPYSKKVLQLYLENAHRDIYDVKQLRLCICAHDDTAVGLIDLFDFDPKNRRAGVGILVLEDRDRNKGIGKEALTLLESYAFLNLDLRQLYANVVADNQPSTHLFKKMGYQEVGVKQDWIYSHGIYKNEILFQKIKK